MGFDMCFLQELNNERRQDVRTFQRHPGIRRTVEDMYPDRAHFIYELLQNAEDVEATHASFELYGDRLVFRHDGNPFTGEDVRGITTIGAEDEHYEDDRIGRFGVGFKSVFAYSETPSIWSPTYSFQISDFVVPNEIALRTEDLGEQTEFEFPFNNPQKDQDLAFAEIRDGLNQLAETTLLFLNNLESISWRIENAESGNVLRIEHSNDHIEVLKEIKGETTKSCHFLKFSEPIRELTTQNVTIAFKLDFLKENTQFDSNKPIATQLRITSMPQARVAIFFPAEKEISGLRFYLHAPFVPTVDRSSVKDTPANEPLFDQLSKLAAASLYKIRDHGLLTTDFLEVLPNNQDPLLQDEQEHRPSLYEPIRESIIEAMKKEPLTPTYDGSHAPARDLLQANVSLKKLLGEDELQHLEDDIRHIVTEYDGNSPRWAVGANQKNTNTDRFLSSLNIRNFGIEEFVQLLAYRTSQQHIANDPDADFLQWLTTKSLEWHRQLYAMLNDSHRAGWELEQCVIVRLGDGTYRTGAESFFPDEGIQDDQTLPRVEKAVYGDQQNNPSRAFLETIGVRVVDEAAQVEAILNQRYTEAEIPNEKTHLRDLKRFIDLVENEPDKKMLFQNYYIFKCEDDKWRKPSGVYLDEPFLETGLGAYYTAQENDNIKRFALDGQYQNDDDLARRIVTFAQAVGAQKELEIIKCTCTGHPKEAYLKNAPGNRRSDTGCDRDHRIRGLENLLEINSLDLSKLVWRTMCDLPEDYLRAKYRKNRQSVPHCHASTLVHILRDKAWVPQGDNSFVRPAEASHDSLPDGFAFDPGWGWIKAINFGAQIAKDSEEQRQKKVAAKELGFDDENKLEDAQKFAQLPPDIRRDILAKNWKVGLPENAPANPERRAQKVTAKAAEAPDRQTEIRERSVSVTRESVKKEAKPYLERQYTNLDGIMICQICRRRLPFKRNSGDWYFECIEIMEEPELTQHHFQNYLALCPNHAAMFKHANELSSSELKNKIIDPDIIIIDDKAGKLEIKLANQDQQIHFTETHLADLQNLIKAEKNMFKTMLSHKPL